MESLISAVAPRSPAPAKKLSEVDFRSGATLDQLSSQVSELVLLEQGDFGDQTALEVHTAKDFIFNMLGTSPPMLMNEWIRLNLVEFLHLKPPTNLQDFVINNSSKSSLGFDMLFQANWRHHFSL